VIFAGTSPDANPGDRRVASLVVSNHDPSRHSIALVEVSDPVDAADWDRYSRANDSRIRDRYWTNNKRAVLTGAVVGPFLVRPAGQPTAVKEGYSVLAADGGVLAVARSEALALQRRVTGCVVGDQDSGRHRVAFIGVGVAVNSANRGPHGGADHCGVAHRNWTGVGVVGDVRIVQATPAIVSPVLVRVAGKEAGVDEGGSVGGADRPVGTIAGSKAGAGQRIITSLIVSNQDSSSKSIASIGVGDPVDAADRLVDVRANCGRVGNDWRTCGAVESDVEVAGADIGKVLVGVAQHEALVKEGESSGRANGRALAGAGSKTKALQRRVTGSIIGDPDSGCSSKAGVAVGLAIDPANRKVVLGAGDS